MLVPGVLAQIRFAQVLLNFLNDFVFLLISTGEFVHQ